MWCVYLIERDDGKGYVGQTTVARLATRMGQHARSKRFRGHTFTHRVLYETASRDDALAHEAAMVAHHDTYRNGLNRTPHGHGLHKDGFRFTTLGRPMDDDTKAKIRATSKRNRNHLYVVRHFAKHPEAKVALKAKLSAIRKGRFWGRRKFTPETLREVVALYHTQPAVAFDVGVVQRNGRAMPYARAFAKTYASRFGMTPAYVHRLITEAA